MRDNDYDLFRVLPFKENGIEIPVGERLDTLFSQVFLFFDYDFQNRMGTERLDIILKDMLDYFNDETGCGKLYVNYPMVESLKYTKEMPDINYFNYVVSREECLLHKFKNNIRFRGIWVKPLIFLQIIIFQKNSRIFTHRNL